MKVLRVIAPYFLIVLLCVFSVLPLINPYFYPMHDDEQIARLYDLDQAIKYGHIPPRIVPNLGYGYGYPFYNFYPPFAYYVGEMFHLVGFGYILSTKLMLVTGFILSALFMYVFVKEFYGRLAGIVSAVAYTYFSYRAVDVYVRGAYAEFYSFVFIPLIFYSVYKISKSNSLKYVILGSLGTAGLILSHNLVAFMSSVFIGIWVLYCWYISKKKKTFALFTFISFLLGFGLSAYFFIPSYLERDFTLIKILTQELADYRLHFVCAYQLWDSMWGYGGSILGCHDGISFEVGKVQLAASLIAFSVASYLVLVRRRIKILLPTIIFSFFLLISLFLMVKHSGFIWGNIPQLWYVQFPWRFLIFSGFFSAFLTGSLMGVIRGKWKRYILSGILIILIIFTTVFRFTPQRFINVSDSFYTNEDKIRWDTSNLAYEYVPSGVATKKSKAGTTQVDINKDEVAESSFKLLTGVADVFEVNNLPHYKKFNIKVFEPGIFQINTFSFPGWKAFLGGKEVQFKDSNKLKLIQVNLPEGTHVLEVKFTDTMPRIIGNYISLTSIILLVVLGFFSIRVKKNAKTS